MSLPHVAAGILHEMKDKKCAVRTAVYSSTYDNKKQLMSLVCDCIKYSSVLNEVLDLCNLQSSDKRLKKNRELAVVILCRHLFGKALNGSYSKFKKLVESQKSAIHSAVVRVKLKHKVTDLKDAVASQPESSVLPRYVRVNSLLTTPTQVVTQFEADGYKRKEADSVDQNDSTLKWVSIDSDVDNVLVLPPNTDLHANELVVHGHIILQDKASCLPAFILNPPPGSHVVDACAAPGNKTTHLAALLNNTGSVTAFEMNAKRCKVLQKMLSKAKVTCCRVENADFTKCDVSKYNEVEYILVDPSCSGSGIAGRLGSVVEDQQSYSEERLKKLSSFQSVILKKALSFPRVKKVVYSTCSVHSQENEEVVKDVLSQMEGKFTLERIMPAWTHRGDTLSDQFSLGAHCIRASPHTTRTIGFFVALFSRTC